MNDLEVIARKNAEAVEASIPALLKQGKYVVARFIGLHFVDCETFSVRADAVHRAAQIDAQKNSERGVLYEPAIVPASGADPFETATRSHEAMAAQAQHAKVVQVDAPAPRAGLTYSAVQVIAMVVTDGTEVWPLPPHQAAVVCVDNDLHQIAAVCGPTSDLASTQDAWIFSKAYELRDALDTVLRMLSSFSFTAEEAKTCTQAQAVLESATPIFAQLKKPSAEEALDKARENYDPAANGDTSSILSPEQTGSFDATPSSSN